MQNIEIRESSPRLHLPESKTQMVYNLLNKGRRIFGRAGANLTLLDNPEIVKQLPVNWKCPTLDVEKKARENFGKLLQDWIQDKPNAVVINSVKIGDVPPNVDETGVLDVGYTDAVLIIGSHVLLFDVHAFKPGKDEEHIAQYAQKEDGTIVTATGRPVPGGEIHLTEDIKIWFNNLKTEDQLNLLGAVVVMSDNTKVLRLKNYYNALKNYYWYFLEKSRVVETLDKWYSNEISDEEKTFISTDLVEQFAVKMVKPYSRINEIINTNLLGKI